MSETEEVTEETPTVETRMWMSAEHGTCVLPVGEVPEWAVVPVQVPAESDKKSAWVEYAESLGIEPGTLTKDELIAAVRETEQ